MSNVLVLFHIRTVYLIHIMTFFITHTGKVVIDAFRLTDPRMQALGQEPRQTTSNLGHLQKPSIQVTTTAAYVHVDPRLFIITCILTGSYSWIG